MLTKILFWGAVVWFAFEILRRLAVSVFLIFEGYSERGLGGALVNALIAFLVNLWAFFKTVFWAILAVFIFALVVRGCGK
jgi:hypothetical protein